jgi:hypothetical protein
MLRSAPLQGVRLPLTLFKKVLSKTSLFGEAFFLKERLWVNSTGDILTFWLAKLRGTPPPHIKMRGILWCVQALSCLHL